MSRRLLRYAVGICAALALIYGVRTYNDASIDVTLVYGAPPGQLEVVLRDAEGERLRRSVFGGPERRHSVTLPRGRYRAELRMAGRSPAYRAFEVNDASTIELNW